MITSSSISAEQLAFFKRHGYLVAENVIDLATIDAVRDELQAVFDQRAREMHAEGLLPEPFSAAGFDRQLAKVADLNMDLARELITRVHDGRGEGGHIGPAMFDLMKHPGLLDAVEAMVGPEIVGSSVYRVRPKAPGLDKGAVPWHQDSGYILAHCDKELVVTCWIPLVDATEENGCLYVLPDAHRNGIIRHHHRPAGYLIITDDDLPKDSAPVAVPVPKGGVLFLTNLTPHASFLNTSDHVRWSVDLRYQSASVPNNLDKMPDEIDYDGPEIEIACYPPEADFVLRSPSSPEREVRDWRVLKERRDNYLKRFRPGPIAGRWKRLEE